MTHESFPSRLYIWDGASRKLAELQCFTGPSLLKHFLPDPAIFVNPSSRLKSSLVLSWLRIRPVFLWRLGLPDPPSFPNREWRSILEAADNFRTGSQDRKEKLDILQSLVKESHSRGIVLDEQNISSAPARWNNQLVQCNTYGSLDPQLVCEVVWELYEAKFRLEILTIDRHLVPEPQGHGEEVQMQKEEWFLRELLAHHPYITQPGLSSSSNHSLRTQYLRGLFYLVKGSPGKKPLELEGPFPKDDDDLGVKEIEDVLANYYICVFVKVYHRPPTIPHFL